jgi:uncharacterized protein YabE (DUF348 family)
MLCASALGTVSQLQKDVNLQVDGQTLRLSTFAITVGDVLGQQGIEVQPDDHVTPLPTDPLKDGQVIEVKYAKPLTLTIDGKTEALTSYAFTVSEALDMAEVSGLENAEFSLPVSTKIPREGLEVTINTPKNVTLTVAGKERKVSTMAATVAELLEAEGVAVDGDDVVAPGADTPLSDGDKVKVDVVEVKEMVKEEAIPFETKTTKDKTMWAGETKTKVEGKEGTARRTYKVTVVNGKKTSTEMVAEKVLSEPVAAQVVKGTKVSPDGTGINLARKEQWERIAQCESSGNWSINTGNGYYGGLQFNKQSWDANGGRDFAAYPHQATKEQQITVANRYWEKSGFSPWTCKP